MQNLPSFLSFLLFLKLLISYLDQVALFLDMSQISDRVINKNDKAKYISHEGGKDSYHLAKSHS